MIREALDSLRDRKRRRQWNPAHAAGRRAEDLAHRHLQHQGYIVIARNYRLPSGDAEADIVAWEGDTLAIVEVKSRESAAYGPPERAISQSKRSHMARVGREFAARTATPWEQVRFDVVTVVFTDPPQIELYRGH